MKASDLSSQVAYAFARMKEYGGKPVHEVRIAGHYLKLRQSVNRRGKRFNYQLGPLAVAKWWAAKLGHHVVMDGLRE